MSREPVGWILRWGKRWVRIDTGSGGYPVGVERPHDATIFRDTDRAVDYAKRVGVNAQPVMLWIEES